MLNRIKKMNEIKYCIKIMSFSNITLFLSFKINIYRWVYVYTNLSYWQRYMIIDGTLSSHLYGFYAVYNVELINSILF